MLEYPSDATKTVPFSIFVERPPHQTATSYGLWPCPLAFGRAAAIGRSRCLRPPPRATGHPASPPPVPESRPVARLASSAMAPQRNKALRTQRNAPSAYENQPTTTRISAYGMSTRSPKHGVSVQRHGVCPPRILLPVRCPSPRQRPTAGLLLPERCGTDPRPFDRTPRRHLQRTRPLVEQITPPTAGLVQPDRTGGALPSAVENASCL